MRSRYTAFAIEDASYLRASWHPHTRPSSIEFDPDLQWRRLVIIDRLKGGPFDDEGVVEFEAYWSQHGTRGSMRERSRFVREDRRWFYVDGDVQ